MKKIMLLTVAMCCLLALTLGEVSAQGTEAPDGLMKLDTKLDLAYVSKYVWRGLALNPDPAFQPSLTISSPDGLSYNLWASMDTTNIPSDDPVDNSGSITEYDHTLSYAWSSGKTAMTAGLIHYAFPNTTFNSTNELFANACFGGPFTPSIGANWDFDEAKGAYLALGAAYGCNLRIGKTAPTTVNFTGKLGWGSANYNKFYFYGYDKSGLVDFVLGASAPLAIGDKFTLTPAVSYSTVVNSDIEDQLDANKIDSDNFVAGITASYSF